MTVVWRRFCGGPSDGLVMPVRSDVYVVDVRADVTQYPMIERESSRSVQHTVRYVQRGEDMVEARV